MIELMKSHRSIRKFKERSVSKELVNEIITAGQWAPTSHHIQSYSIIVVRDHSRKKRLAELAGNQPYVESCPVFFVICADYSRLSKASEMHQKPFEIGEVEQIIVGAVDAALVAENMLLASRGLGLGGVMIGGIRNSPEAVSTLLKLPKFTFPIMGLCIGYPDQNPEQKPRLSQRAVVHEEEYDETKMKEELGLYDQVMSDYYNRRTNGKRMDTWTKLMSEHFSQVRRQEVGEFLKKQGFLKED
ncbi:oxygen-insensitive NADPH nitroreductase [Bacillus sp. JCM 19034]|uniref:oxygen-insensitive NADPH nitroreductase n=1 Tax=Bacillus sp. JCM 19034 TaxID=1481928 RepID=UPI000B0C94E2|nr:oxygen-insensitive NADPH nitroreductase [Bacillus sp. JCM 19034]